MNTPGSDPENEALSWEHYLRLEAESELRFEYHDGQIVAMAGASNRHNEIAGNCYVHLKSAARTKGCKGYAMEVKLFRYQSKKYFYPDGIITCNPLDLQSHNGIKSPLVLVEVLSNSTRAADRGIKLREYLKLPNLQHYLIIEQTHCEVQHYRRREDQSWEVLFYESLEEEIPLSQLDLTLSLADLYLGVEFGPEIEYVEEEESPAYEETSTP